MTYYNVGKLIVEAQGGRKKAEDGDGLIKDFVKKLIVEVNKKYSERTLKYIRAFYLFQKSQPVFAQLSWSHYIQLLSFNNKSKYYIDEVIKRKLSKRQLQEK